MLCSLEEKKKEKEVLFLISDPILLRIFLLQLLDIVLFSAVNSPLHIHNLFKAWKSTCVCGPCTCFMLVLLGKFPQKDEEHEVLGAWGSPLLPALWPCQSLLPTCFPMAFRFLWFYSSSPNLFNLVSAWWIFVFFLSLPSFLSLCSTRVIFDLYRFLCGVGRGWKILFLTTN